MPLVATTDAPQLVTVFCVTAILSAGCVTHIDDAAYSKAVHVEKGAAADSLPALGRHRVLELDDECRNLGGTRRLIFEDEWTIMWGLMEPESPSAIVFCIDEHEVLEKWWIMGRH